MLSLFAAFFLMSSAASSQRVIPFCSYCECLFATDDGSVDLDCTGTDLRTGLLDPYFWRDDRNVSYDVASLRGRNAALEIIDVPFPSSTLRDLDLADNRIEDVVDGAFAHLQNMESLDLSNNSLEQLKPDAFKGTFGVGRYYPLKALRILKLGRNKMEVLHRDLFEHVDAVEELYLGGNPLRRIVGSTEIALRSLPELRVLDLSGALLETIPADLFSPPGFARLELLDLSENLLVAVPDALRGARSLEVLFMDGNPVPVLDSGGCLGAPSNLRILGLSRMPDLEAIEAGALAGLAYLEELHLNDDPFLGRIDEDAFRSRNGAIEAERAPRLRLLDLAGCNLSRLSAETLSDWKALDHLNLDSNPWTCDCHSQVFIETVALVSAEVANRTTCVSPLEYVEWSFGGVKEAGVTLPCPLDESFGSFRCALLFVALLNCLFLVGCVCRRRLRRGTVYVTLRNVP